MNCPLCRICEQPATNIVLYGCYNMHILERWYCNQHYPSILETLNKWEPETHIKCGICREPYQATLTSTTS